TLGHGPEKYGMVQCHGCSEIIWRGVPSNPPGTPPPGLGLEDGVGKCGPASLSPERHEPSSDRTGTSTSSRRSGSAPLFPWSVDGFAHAVVSRPRRIVLHG
ncbi:hypothetical protein EIK77_002385, partial [Talaromyces pinophilus]